MSRSNLSMWREFAADEAGGPAVEYAIMAALIAMTILVALVSMSDRLGSTYNTVSASLP